MRNGGGVSLEARELEIIILSWTRRNELEKRKTGRGEDRERQLGE